MLNLLLLFDAKICRWRTFELVRTVLNFRKPDVVINCAAYTAVDNAESFRDLAFLINGESVGVLAAVCSELGGRFIHISTDYVFDGTSHVPYRETDPTSPVNTYGASKLEGEEQALKFNPDSIIVRTSWVYSAYGKNFVKTMMKLMSERKEINVVDDQLGCPTYAADLAETLFHIATGSACSRRDLSLFQRRSDQLVSVCPGHSPYLRFGLHCSSGTKQFISHAG